MQVSIVAIQQLELTSVSGSHESPWRFSELNECTGPTGQSSEVSDGALAAQEEGLAVVCIGTFPFNSLRKS